MLDLALCTHSASHWLVIKSMLFRWLMTPALVVLALTAVTLLPWMLPKFTWKRQLVRLGGALLVIYFIATFPLTIALANKGLVTFIPDDPGVKADAIVILGRGEKFRPARVAVAAKLWRSRRAPLIFASGAGDGGEIESDLKKKGIPESAIAKETCSRTTEENALFTASVLRRQGVKKILLVTDPPHMLRSLMTFSSLGFKVFPHSSPLPTDIATPKQAVMVFYEYMGLVSYGLKGYIFPPTIANEKNHYYTFIREIMGRSKEANVLHEYAPKGGLN